MKVCHLLNSAGTGGAEVMVLELLRRTECPDVSYTVAHLGTYRGLVPEYEKAGARVVDLGARWRPPQIDPRVLPSLFAEFRTHEFDVVHAHNPFVQVLGRIVGGVSRDTEVISTHHSVREYYLAPVRGVESATRSLDSATVAVSEGVQQSFTGRSNVYPATGVRDGWCTIRNGIDVDRFAGAVADAADEAIDFVPEDDDVVFLNVGRFVPEKGQHSLIEAMDVVRSELPNSHLLLVGSSGPLEADLRTEVSERGLEDHVTVVHQEGGRSSIHKYYAVADVFVSASVREGLPVTQLEAMAAGLPIVATDIPGTAEVVVQGETGYLVPVDATSELASALAAFESPERRRDLGQQASRRVKREFDIRQTIDAYVDLYRDVLD